VAKIDDNLDVLTLAVIHLASVEISSWSAISRIITYSSSNLTPEHLKELREMEQEISNRVDKVLKILKGLKP
jgi:predicted nucleotidyltransferase